MKTRYASMIACLLVMSALVGGCSRQENAPATTSDQSNAVSVANSDKPVAVSVTPVNGSGAAQSFIVKFSQPGGYEHLYEVRLLINSILNGGNACFVYYELPTKSFVLVNDGGLGITRVALGTGKSIQNSQCTVYTHGGSAVGQANDLTVVIPIQFKRSFIGRKKLFLWAVATNQANTDFVLSGQYTVTK